MNENNLSNATFVITVHEEKKAFVISAFLTILTWEDTLNQFMKETNLSNATFVVTVHEEKNAFQCNICNYSFSHKPNLKRHIKSVHEGKK